MSEICLTMHEMQYLWRFLHRDEVNGVQRPYDGPDLWRKNRPYDHRWTMAQRERNARTVDRTDAR